MTKLFDKAIVFTDIHFGLRHNSKQHNDDCIAFIKWMIALAKVKGIKTCIFTGDYTHHRNAINTMTHNYMLEGFSLLNEGFDDTYFLVGNHDMYFKDNRTITSTKPAQLYPNIHFIDSPIIKDDVALIPWLVNDEWQSLSTMKAKYLFGHLEIPGFKMNAMIDMPDNGKINSKHFGGFDYVFSGHFHKRQNQGNVHYLGNPFGHNYSDIWDFDRGCMILEWGGKPEFVNWEDGPRFISIALSKLLVDPAKYLSGNVYAQVTIDIPVNYEDASSLKETFTDVFKTREFKLISPRQEHEDDVELEVDTSIQSVDEIVNEQLAAIDSETFQTDILLSIYNNL